MFGQMRASKGFLAADLLPPEAPGGDYQVVINFASEADLAAWDACPARAARPTTSLGWTTVIIL